MGNPHEVTGFAPVMRSPVEEIVNTVTHGIGLAFSLVGATVLVLCALSHGDAWRVAGCGVYAAILVAVYAASTLSHSSSRPSLKRLFWILDQGLIYLLIAATYTPFSLVYLRTGWWWLFLGLIWTVALVGFFSKILFVHRIDSVSIWTYLVLGWLPIISGARLSDLVPAAGLWWMLIGGLCYTIGTAFLIYDRCGFHFHGIWHLLVVAGSSCHFFSILFFVAQAA